MLGIGQVATFRSEILKFLCGCCFESWLFNFSSGYRVGMKDNISYAKMLVKRKVTICY